MGVALQRDAGPPRRVVGWDSMEVLEAAEGEGASREALALRRVVRGVVGWGSVDVVEEAEGEGARRRLSVSLGRVEAMSVKGCGGGRVRSEGKGAA